MIIFVGFRPDSAIGLELQSGVRYLKKHSYNYLDLLLAKVAKRCIHHDKSRKQLQSSRFIASKSREKLQSSQFSTRFFFNHLDLPLAKVALMLFCQKLSRFIASKSCNDLNLPLAKVSKRYNHFDLSLAKLAKM